MTEKIIRDKKFYSRISKQRKTFYTPMKDPEYAKKLSKLAAIARAAKREAVDVELKD